jgi:hypothetical protein
MRLATIGSRIATELRSADLVVAGLLYAYYPAPNKLSTNGPTALIFSGNGGAPPWGEQIWQREIRVQLMTPARGSEVAERNALEALIEPIYDHFAPETTASRLTVAGETETVDHCYAVRDEPSLIVAYGGETNFFTTHIIYLDVQYRRFPGE